MLLDIHAMKTFILEMPTMGMENSAPPSTTQVFYYYYYYLFDKYQGIKLINK